MIKIENNYGKPELVNPDEIDHAYVWDYSESKIELSTGKHIHCSCTLMELAAVITGSFFVKNEDDVLELVNPKGITKVYRNGKKTATLMFRGKTIIPSNETIERVEELINEDMVH